MGNYVKVFTDEAIANYFKDLQFRIDISDMARKEMNVHLANSFNVFQYIRQNENTLSDIIADLLNPQGNHGQTDIFLQEFIKLLQKNYSHDLSKCKIMREPLTTCIINNQRRIDITLTFPDKFTIAIENKPWSGEQKNQLQDYCGHLTKKYGKNFCLIYLSGDGSPPVSMEPKLQNELMKNGRLVVFTYAGHLVKWLESCYKECHAEKVRFFLKDFIQYIKENFEDLYYEEKAADGT